MNYWDQIQENQRKQDTDKKNPEKIKPEKTSQSVDKDVTQDLYRTDATDNLLCTSSATDCTGLIPAGITDEELEAYEQLYPYLPVQSGDTIDRDEHF